MYPTDLSFDIYPSLLDLLHHFMHRVSYHLQSIFSHHLTTSVASSAPCMLLRRHIRLPNLDRLGASGQPQSQPEVDNKSSPSQCWRLLAVDSRSRLLSGSETGLAENWSGSDCSSPEGAHGRNQVDHYIAAVRQGPSQALRLSGLVGRHWKARPEFVVPDEGQVTLSGHCTAARFPPVAGQVLAADHQDALLCSARSPVIDYSLFHHHLLAAVEEVGARLHIGIDPEIENLLSALLLL